MLRFLIYAIMFGCWAYGLYWDINFIPARDGGTWFKKLKYLTVINLTLQTIYFGLCTVRAAIDAVRQDKTHGPHRQHPGMPSYYSNTPLHHFCDQVYALVAFPVGMLVCILFWGLYAIDRDLVYPEELDKIIPQWLNHLMHTAPFPFLLVDTLLICHKMPTRTRGLKVVSVLGVLYMSSIYVWYYFEGFWVYPIFDVLDNTHRGLFMLFGLTLLIIIYFCGELLNSACWGPASHPPSETGSRARMYEKVQQHQTTSNKRKQVRRD